MRTNQLLTWALIGFGVYEVAAYFINKQRLAASGATAPTLLPLDLIGQLTNPNAQNPAAVNAGLANPAAARMATIDAPTTAYPGVTPMPTVPAIDPNNLLQFPSLGRVRR